MTSHYSELLASYFRPLWYDARRQELALPQTSRSRDLALALADFCQYAHATLSENALRFPYDPTGVFALWQDGLFPDIPRAYAPQGTRELWVALLMQAALGVEQTIHFFPAQDGQGVNALWTFCQPFRFSAERATRITAWDVDPLNRFCVQAARPPVALLERPDDVDLAVGIAAGTPEQVQRTLTTMALSLHPTRGQMVCAVPRETMDVPTLAVPEHVDCGDAWRIVRLHVQQDAVSLGLLMAQPRLPVAPVTSDRLMPAPTQPAQAEYAQLSLW